MVVEVVVLMAVVVTVDIDHAHSNFTIAKILIDKPILKLIVLAMMVMLTVVYMWLPMWHFSNYIKAKDKQAHLCIFFI